MKWLTAFCLFIFFHTALRSQNVGIGTLNPQARLHVADSSVVFTGPADPFSTASPNPPVSGTGTRMMWYPLKAAFRAGYVIGAGWDKDSIGSQSTAFGWDTRAVGIASVAGGQSTRAWGTGSIALGTDVIASGSFSTSFGYNTFSAGVSSVAMGYFTKARGDYSTSTGRNTSATGESSTAMGYATNATGSFSTSLGNDSWASGSKSLATGNLTTAIGAVSTAMGYVTLAGGDYSTALGYYTNASGSAAMATGDESVASGIASTAMGYTTTASGQYSVAMGSGTTAAGYSSTALGATCEANGFYSVAIGVNSTASGDGSTALGNGLISRCYSGTVVGLYNDDASAIDPASSNPLNRIFQVGNGTSGNRSNAITVLQNGNTGMGTVNPTRRLEVVGSGANILSVASSSAFGATGIEFVSDYGLSTQWRPGFIQTADLGNFTGRLEFYTNGTGSNNLYNFVKGFEVRNGAALTATGTVGSYSDARLKNAIRPFTDGLNVINQINPVKFRYKEGAPFPTTEEQVGILAQDLEKIAPYMVHQSRENGYDDLRWVNNQAYTFLLINAVKEQQKEIDELRAALTALQKLVMANQK